LSDLPAIITSVAGAVATAGGAVTWLWNKVEARFQEVESELEKCREREKTSMEVAAKHLLVIELLWQAASKNKAAAPTLARCKERLDKLKESKP